MAGILVIDDDPQMRRMLARILQGAGHEVQLAANGLEGLRAFRTLRPDLVITDIVMPVKEGLDTILLLRSWCPEAKIIAISGGSRIGHKDYLAEATELGASAIIAKPFRSEELLAKVAHCLADEAQPCVSVPEPGLSS